MNNNPFILSDLYQYDFSACAYNILKNSGFDVTKICFDNKKLRNIQIGLLQRDNPLLAGFISSNIENLIDFYLKENKVKKEEIILRQKDGLTLTRPITKTDMTMPLDFVGNISKLIFSVDRHKWIIIYTGGEVVPKGFSDLPIDYSFFDMFKNLNYSNCKSLSKGMELIRRSVHTSTNKDWFCIEDDDQFLVPIKNMGLMKFRKSVVYNLDINDIDKRFVWEDYLWPICRAIIVYCVSI